MPGDIEHPTMFNFDEFVDKTNPPAKFKQELKVNMETFRLIHYLIASNPVFQNKSHNKQAPVEIRMAVTFGSRCLCHFLSL